jgi:hypothetical protein
VEDPLGVLGGAERLQASTVCSAALTTMKTFIASKRSLSFQRSSGLATMLQVLGCLV